MVHVGDAQRHRPRDFSGGGSVGVALGAGIRGGDGQDSADARLHQHLHRRCLGSFRRHGHDRGHQRRHRTGDGLDPRGDRERRRQGRRRRPPSVRLVGRHAGRGAPEVHDSPERSPPGPFARDRRGHRRGSRHADHLGDDDPGRPARRQHADLRHAARHVRVRGDDRQQPRRQGARRRRRGDHAVELPAPPDHLQARRRPRRRLHLRAQAERSRAAQRLHPRRDRARDRPARRRVQPGHRHRPGRRCGDLGAPRRRHGELHRIDPRRQAGRRGRRRHRQARRPRTRWQVGQHRARRRRLRRGHPEGALRLLPQLGPDLHGAHPHARPEQPLRRGRRHRRGGRRADAGRRSHAPRASTSDR